MGIKERKERERLQRANDILEAARSIFESKGFLNTTLQDVAKEAEISVGLIYRYFQSKEDIFASLALKGAEAFDREMEKILTTASRAKKPPSGEMVLDDIARIFFEYFGPYGEYFDMLLYSYKGLKKIQIHGTTVTRLMSVTLNSIDKLKCYVQGCNDFAVTEEDEALEVVFLLWGILLGTHKLFDSSGRGHLFAFSQDEFMRRLIRRIMRGIATPADPKSKPQAADLFFKKSSGRAKKIGSNAELS